ncbi:MAG: hypothetical protein WCI67_02150 [Chloroflexales bacterium]
MQLVLIALAVLGGVWRAPAAALAAPSDISLPAGAAGLVADGHWLAWYVGDPLGAASRIEVIDASAAGPPAVVDLPTPSLAFVEVNLTLGLPLLSLGDGTLAYLTQGGAGEQEIAAIRLASGARSSVARGAALGAPAAYGGRVYWWSGGAGGTQLHATLLGGASAVLATVGASPVGLISMRASAGWLAWASVSDTTQSVVPCYTLMAIATSGGAVRPIADLGCGPPRFGLHDDQLIYLDRDGALVRQNLSDGTQSRSGPHCGQASDIHFVWHCADLYGFSTDGRYAYWLKGNAGRPQTPSAYDLWGFDMDTGSALVVATGLGQGVSANPPETAAGAGMTAWRWEPGRTSSLHLSATQMTLPTAPEPSLAPADQFFPETGHNLGGDFRAFWERNGGLAVFGYPMTKEFIQQSQDDGRGYPVQYFERQRFEYHPEHAGTPYAVQIGRAGAEAMAAQGRSWWTLPPADPATPHYFGETRQAIAPEFWDYWRTHGLDLGDPGVSQAEALALWGYPISPPTMETLGNGETLLVQYFERARFEYHPDNPEPYRVLLGRLSADQVERYGWR